MKQTNQPYQTYPNDSHHDSRAKGKHIPKNKNSSRPNIVIEGDIPLLPVMPIDNTAPSAYYGANQGVLGNSKSKVSIVSSGAIPLLDLSE